MRDIELEHKIFESYLSIYESMIYVKHKVHSSVFGTYLPKIKVFEQWSYYNPNPLTKKEIKQGHRDKPAVVWTLKTTDKIVGDDFFDTFVEIDRMEFLGLDAVAFSKG